MNRQYVLLLAFVAGAIPLFAQRPADTLVLYSHYTSFPDSVRAQGHIYDSVLYDADTHYRDSTVLVFVPPGWTKQDKPNLVFWFHGWRNNVANTIRYYQLARQFTEAHPKALLILAEAAKDAPDSYGGKLEQPGVFSSLVNDVLNQLKQRKLAGSTSPHRIILAGHSGAYRVIARILKNGGLPVDEVDLFDALYGETPIYLDWIKSDPAHRFINWYTNQGGGTDEVSIQFMDELKREGLPVSLKEETDLSENLVRNTRLLFVHSARAHNDILFTPDNFELLMKASPFLH